MTKTILFQGDSVTDALRNYNDENYPGHGYPTMVKGELGCKYPGDYVFINRGVSGNRIVDLYARMRIDIENLKPDYLSILIGVNDVWHEIACKNGVPTKKFEKVYSMLIEELKEEFPNLKIMLLEPFVLEGEATKNCDEIPDRCEQFYVGVREKAAATKRVAEKYGLTFIPLQEKFDEAEKKTPQPYWLADGVHPTSMGHNLIKEEWLKAFEKIK